MGSEKVYRDYSSCSSCIPFASQPASHNCSEQANQRADRQTEYNSIKCPPDDLLFCWLLLLTTHWDGTSYACTGLGMSGRKVEAQQLYGLWLAIAHNYL